jgi:FixJ family two-component response regulator
MPLQPDHLVYVLDDDRRVRESVIELLSSLGTPAVAFASSSEYLAYPKPDVPSCLVLDVRLPDINGLDLQGMQPADEPPIVFVTGYGDIPSSVRAMKAGAVDFLVMPFQAEELIRAVQAALERSRASRIRQHELAELRRRLASLTPREREVLPLVASGLLNKQAAGDLAISEVTLQIHRGNIMKKMKAGSLAELVRMASQLGIPLTRLRHSPPLSD